MTKPREDYSLKAKKDELWRRGVLHWKLHAGQLKMRKALLENNNKTFVINSSRRLGKSFLLVLLALETALQKPNAQVKYASFSQKSVKKIVMPIMRQILEDCPKHLRPTFHNHEAVWRFPNGSEIHVAGTEMQQIDSLRGQACDLGLVDEAGFVSDLKYVVGSVLMPQTLGRPDSRIILASTPPVTPDHDFVRIYMERAMSQDAYACFTIYDNPLLTAEQVMEYMEESGGEDSTTWRREYLCHIVTESENALFPEATEDDYLNQMILEVKKPDFYIPITVVDLGYVDYTGILFGYYHFPLGKVIIEDEILVNKVTSEEIVRLCLEKERELWGVSTAVRERIVDGNAMQIADLNQTHKFGCRAPSKSDLEANVNKVRLDLQNQHVLFNPRCIQTTTQLRFATWDNSRTKFSRSSSGGHWDLAASLMYLLKHVDRRTNPYPADYGYSLFTHWGFPRKHPLAQQEQMKKMFPVIRRKPRSRKT